MNQTTQFSTESQYENFLLDVVPHDLTHGVQLLLALLPVQVLQDPLRHLVSKSHTRLYILHLPVVVTHRHCTEALKLAGGMQ